MKKRPAIKTLFVDVGGVLLTNGWDHEARQMASQIFKLNLDEMESRHRLTFDTYETGKLSLEEYLNRIVFYEKRSFTHSQFRDFMFAQSKPYPKTIELIRALKVQHGLKIVVVSNEGRELNEYRVNKFKLNNLVDFFISSSYVHLRKPDVDIYRMALDLSHTPPKQVAYIEDREMFVQIAEKLGIQGIRHTDPKTTQEKLLSLGLKL